MKKPKGSDRSRAMKLADKYFSQYVRLKFAKDNNVSRHSNEFCSCITCNDIFHWLRIDCGHFMSREYQSTRYDERNTAPQCQSCNRFKSGKQYEFGWRLDERYGKGTAEGMYIKSKILCPRKTYDFKYIANEYRLKVNELKKEL